MFIRIVLVLGSLLLPTVAAAKEVNITEYLPEVKFTANGRGILVDSRVEPFYTKGTIPGSVNIPFTTLTASDKDPGFRQALARLGVMTGESVNWSNSIHRSVDGLGEDNRKLDWDFSRAKDILLFCNGPWCDQSPRAIQALLRIGYPANKIYYYRC